jgi:hypothetical protein
MKILLIVTLAIAALFGGLLLWWWLEEGRKLVFLSRRFGERVTLPRREGLVVAELWFHLEEEGGRLLGVAKLRHGFEEGPPQRRAVEEFPMIAGRYRVEWHGKRIVSVHEVPCDDETFLRSAKECIPLVDGEWRGIRIAAPARIAWRAGVDSLAHVPRRLQVPAVPVAGIYILESALFDERDARAGDVQFVITNTATGKSQTLTLPQIRREYNEKVFGMQPIIHRDPAPPVDRKIPKAESIQTNRATGSDFVIDIGLYIPRPRAPEIYQVYAQCPPHLSETLRIAVDP